MELKSVKQGLEKLILPLYLAGVITYSGVLMGQRIKDHINSVASVTDYSTSMHPHYKAFDRNSDGQIDEIREYTKFVGMRVAAPSLVFIYREGAEGFDLLREKLFND